MASSSAISRRDAIQGVLLGTAIGDALGLPMEGLSAIRQSKLFPSLDCHQFIGHYGMISDDTEHTTMVAQALIQSRGEPQAFARLLGWKLRFWLLGLPAGIGLATLRAILKLWLGFPPSKSGVFSAGNGPAMRSGIIGAAYGDRPERLTSLVKASTRLTHHDPQAEYGALAVAWATHYAAQGKSRNTAEFLTTLATLLPPEADSFLDRLYKAHQSALAGENCTDFILTLGCKQGISGYINHTVPAVFQVWFSEPNNIAEALKRIIRCGGDTDTTAAILGGIMGASLPQFPSPWVEGLKEWPRSKQWLMLLGERLALSLEGQETKALPLNPLGVLIRNILFLGIVLLHGFRRLLPPYS